MSVSLVVCTVCYAYLLLGFTFILLGTSMLSLFCCSLDGIRRTEVIQLRRGCKLYVCCLQVWDASVFDVSSDQDSCTSSCISYSVCFVGLLVAYVCAGMKNVFGAVECLGSYLS